MTRLLKILAWAVGALVLLIVVAIISLPLIIDPNDYRDEIGALVKKQTGRDLVIQGDLKLSVFPWLGVNAGATQLSNAPGFGPEPFARFDHAKVAVKLLPLLLRREVELDTIELDKLRLNLARDRQGRNNWDDLVASAKNSSSEPSKPEEKGRAPLAYRVGGIKVRDAEVAWNDKAANRTAQVGNLNLSTGALDLTSPIVIDLATDFSVSAPQVAGHLSLKGTLHHDETEQRYRTEKLTLALDAHGSALPGGAVKVSLTGDAAADLKAQTAELKNLHVDGYGARLGLNATAAHITTAPDGRGELDLQVKDPETLSSAFAPLLPPKLRLEPRRLAGTRLTSRFDFSLSQGTLNLPDLAAKLIGLQLTATVHGTEITKSPRFTGQLQLAQFVPRDLLAALGVTPPAAADGTVLGKASFSARFDAGIDHAAFEDLALRVDQSSLTGRVAAQRFSPLALRYDLALDQIDLDRYLPPPRKGEKETPATAAATKPLQLPLKELRALDIDGTLRVGQLKAANLRSGNILVTLRAKGGQFRAQPVTATLYSGSYSGDLGLDVRGDTPALAMNENLTGVQIGPLLQDFMGKALVTGKAQLRAQLTARGTDPMEIRKSLNGNGAFAFENGVVNGVDILQLIAGEYAKYLGKATAANPSLERTEFGEMRGTFTVSDGLVNNHDLTVKSPAANMAGHGTANLVNEKVDYHLDATITATNGFLAQFKGQTVPVIIGGTFSKLTYRPDVASAAGKALQSKGQELQKKGQERLQQELNKGLQGLLKKKK